MKVLALPVFRGGEILTKSNNLVIESSVIGNTAFLTKTRRTERNNKAPRCDDESFQGRVDAWHVATAYAIDHFPFGAGFYGPQIEPVFHYYLPDHEIHAAHSIYFQVLGEHGFPALVAYLVMLAAGVLNFQYVARAAGAWAGWGWMVVLARMSHLALLSFYYYYYSCTSAKWGGSAPPAVRIGYGFPWETGPAQRSGSRLYGHGRTPKC
jgi:O-antigen ligase